ncbi:transposase [Candidatus Azambacteria bacterium]|nr:transposase [Candidatus Azambacteria bacterium]
MKRIPFEIESFYHIYNRGVDKRVVFNSNKDNFLFIKYLNILNDIDVVSPRINGDIEDKSPKKTDQRLVNIIAYCLMPNHFHLLLQEITEGGISKFMQRIGTAYTMYFNDLNNRSGALFQGVFKSKYIDNEIYLQKIIDYIHLNPVLHKMSDGVKYMEINWPKLLEQYKWSSYQNYADPLKQSECLQKDILRKYIEVPKPYLDWLKNQNNFDAITDIMFD